MHSYGKTGQQLSSTLSAVTGNVSAVHTPVSAPLPVIVTEHASHTAASWSSIASTTDTDFEASRLASQLLWASQSGIETYVFKFSVTPASSSSGVDKNGCVPAQPRAGASRLPGLS